MSAGTVEVGDGRTLAFEEAGDPAGASVFGIHGTPGCRLSGRHPDLSRVSAAGLRLVTYDRPGYGALPASLAAAWSTASMTSPRSPTSSTCNALQ